jgi:hypothetical protein
MSRSGYSEDCDNLGLWRATVARSINGKRGQAFLREMAAALDAMPAKELINGDVVRSDKSVCAIGSVALARGLNVAELDVTDRDSVGKTFGIAPALAAEIAFENDDDFGYGDRTPAERWTRMRKWVSANLRPSSEPSSVEKEGT